jgi:phosphatidylglycerophosphatase C
MASAAFLGHQDRGKLKAAAVQEFLKGVPRADLERDARAYAAHAAPALLRPDAVEAWRRWRAKGAHLVIVTASPEILVHPFARALGAEWLLGTGLHFDENDCVEGSLFGENCRGEEKVARLRAVFGPDVRLAAAYGDTAGDTEMLAIAEEKGFRVFKGKP